MDPRLQRLTEEGNDNDIIRGIICLKNESVYPPKIKVVTQFGDVITCRLRREDILEVYRHPAVFSFKAPRYYYPDNDLLYFNEAAAGWKNLEQNSIVNNLQKREVYIGIIDYGIDFRNINFIDNKGKSRIKYFWDQSSGINNPPAGFDYGRLITDSNFNEALIHVKPGSYLKYFPNGGHGTHVTDIACGNGRVGKKGIAPFASIIGVHLGITDKVKGDLGDSVSILEAIDFLSRAAGKHPLVINMSIGAHGGHHTGKTLVERGIDNFLESMPDRIICQSCGNYRSRNVHTSGRVPPGKKTSINFTIKNNSSDTEIEIWYQSRDIIHIGLQHQNLAPVYNSTPGKSTKLKINNKNIISVYHRVKEPNTGLNQINIFIDKDAPSGKWLLLLNGYKISDGRYHVWIERNDNNQAEFDKAICVEENTINTICNGYNTISVGAYDENLPGVNLAKFSSCGPTVDGREKPDLVAPGVGITASVNSSEKDCIHTLQSKMSGTSMASPHVTGTAAIIFSKLNESVNIHQFKKILYGVVDQIKIPPNDKKGIGYGVLNIYKAIEQKIITI